MSKTLEYQNWIKSVQFREIIMKLLLQQKSINALIEERAQKNIIKIFLVRLYAGSELLSRIPMVKWDTSLDKELLNAIESHLKEPFQLIYSHKPLLTFVLLIEFLEKL